MSAAGPFGLWTAAAAGSIAVHGIVGFTLYAMPMPEVRQPKPTEIRFASPDQGTATALAPAEAATALVARGVARATAPTALTALSGGRPAPLGPSAQPPRTPPSVAAEAQSPAAIDRLAETATATEAEAGVPEAGAVEAARIARQAAEPAQPMPADPATLEAETVAALDETPQAVPDIAPESLTLSDRSAEAATSIPDSRQAAAALEPGVPDAGEVAAAPAPEAAGMPDETTAVAALDETPEAIPDITPESLALSDRSAEAATSIPDSRQVSAAPAPGVPDTGTVAAAPVPEAAAIPDETTTLAALEDAPQPLQPQAGTDFGPLPDSLREQIQTAPAAAPEGSQAEPANPGTGLAITPPPAAVEPATEETTAIAALGRQAPALAPAADATTATPARAAPAARPSRATTAVAPKAASTTATRVDTPRPAPISAAPVPSGSPTAISGNVAAVARPPVAAPAGTAAPVIASQSSVAADGQAIAAVQAPATAAASAPLQPRTAPVAGAPASAVIAPSASEPASAAPVPEADQRTALILQPTITQDPAQGSPAGQPGGKLRIGDFLATREGDDCLLAVPASQGVREASVEAFAISEDAVARLGSDYEKQSGLVLKAATRPVSRDQCSALIFARSLPQYPNFQLRLTVSDPTIRSGRVLHGVVSGLRKDTLYLIVVDDEGKAKLLDSFPGVRATLMTFSEPVHLTSGPVASVQLLIAVAADGALKTMPDRKGMPADEFFSRLATEIVLDNRSIAYGITSFVVD